MDELIEVFRRLEVPPERLLDDESGPVLRAVVAARGVAGEPRLRERLDGGRKYVRRQREIENAIGRLVALALEQLDARGQRPEVVRRALADALVEHGRVDPLLDLLRRHAVVLDRLAHEVAVLRVIHSGIASDTEDGAVVADESLQAQ